MIIPNFKQMTDDHLREELKGLRAKVFNMKEIEAYILDRLEECEQEFKERGLKENG